MQIRTGGPSRNKDPEKIQAWNLKTFAKASFCYLNSYIYWYSFLLLTAFSLTRFLIINSRSNEFIQCFELFMRYHMSYDRCYLHVN